MNCEQVRIAAMALADGENPPLSRVAVDAHVAECEECRKEIAELGGLGRMWEGQARQVHPVELWPRVAEHIADRRTPSERHWLPALVAMLVVFKLIEFVPNRGFGMWVQLVPLLLAIAGFALAGQNPFQIKTELGSPKT